MDKKVDNTELKIAMFGHKTIPSREGGIEIVVEEICKRMVENGNDITCFNRSGNVVYKDGEKPLKEYKGINIKFVPTIKRKGFAALSSAFFAALRSSFGKYDVVHIHAEGPAIFSFIPKLFGKCVIVTVHGLDWKRKKWNGGFGAKCIHLGEKAAVKYADEIIVLSHGVQKYFKDTYNRDTIFITNGVNRPKILEANLIKQKFGLEKNSYILYLGRIVPEKGIHYLVEAFKNVKTDKKLVIAGASSDTDEYMNKIIKMAESDSRIIFTSFVEGQMLEELYSNDYIYCLPSDLEGMSISLLEAMSYGNCCLTSDIDECTEVIEENGVVFEKSNINDLQFKLQMLCDNLELVKKYKSNAADYICNKYNWDTVVKETLNVYERKISVARGVINAGINDK